VTAQNTQHIGELAQVAQRVAADRLIYMADKVQIKKVLPWLAAKRPGFDLHEIQIARCKDVQRPGKRPGSVLGSKYKRSLPLSALFRPRGHAPGISRAAQGEKPGEVLAVVLYGT